MRIEVQYANYHHHRRCIAGEGTEVERAEGDRAADSIGAGSAGQIRAETRKRPKILQDQNQVFFIDLAIAILVQVVITQTRLQFLCLIEHLLQFGYFRRRRRGICNPVPDARLDGGPAAGRLGDPALRGQNTQGVHHDSGEGE